MKCELCKIEHDGSYASGRFCNETCARAFSSRLSDKNRKKTIVCYECGNSFEGSVHASSIKTKCKNCNPPKERRIKYTTNNCICVCCEKSYVYKKNTTRSLCSYCIYKISKHKRRAEIVNYKGGKCYVCGYDRHIDALAFHHIDPTQKNFIICLGYNKKWEELKTEADKCVLLCSNCHIEVHANFICVLLL